MMHPAADIRTLLQPGKRVHLAGIGGVSMCALAEVLQGMGLVVQGSDMTESDTLRHLRSLGIQVAIGHSAEYLKNCEYKEFFVSGIYNVLAAQGARIAGFACDLHLPFGTPDEYRAAEAPANKAGFDALT